MGFGDVDKIERSVFYSYLYIVLNILKIMDQQASNLIRRIYAKEFDEGASKYNEWLAKCGEWPTSLEDQKVQRSNKLHSFLRGMGSVLDIFGVSLYSNFRYCHPLYSRGDLSPTQRDAIALASDWQRVDRALDKIISGDSSERDFSVEEARVGKRLVREMYEHLRNVYISHSNYRG